MTTVVRFPRPGPAYEPTKRARLQPGQALPKGVCRLHPEAPRIVLTPERMVLAALAGALPPKGYEALLSRLGREAFDGSYEALIALRIATGDL